MAGNAGPVGRYVLRDSMANPPSRLRLDADAVPDAWLVVDEAGLVAEANPRLAILAGRDLGALAAVPAEHLFAEPDPWRDLVDACLLGGMAVRELHLLRTGSAPLVVEAAASAQTGGIVVCLRALPSGSRNAAVANDLRHAVDQARARFAATMSHELRTPLTAIIGTCDLLDGMVEGDSRDLVATQRDQARALLALIDRVLDLNAAEGGALELDLTDFSPLAVVEEALHGLASRAHLAGMELVLTPGDMPALVHGDASRLRQVVAALVDNAVVHAGTGTIEVILAGQVNGSQAVMQVAVRDEGPGLDPKLAADPWRPFSQGDGTTTRRHDGAGLSLALCKRLVERMGGSIRLDNRPGRGLTVSFTARFSSARLAVGSDSETIGRVSGVHRVLVADARERSLRALCVLLRRAGLVPEPATSGPQAVAMWRDAAYAGASFAAAVVADDLPGIALDSLVRMVGGDPDLRQTPLILTVSAGATSHPDLPSLVRPVRLDDLRRVLMPLVK
jgi:signal transduction histidine kinase